MKKLRTRKVIKPKLQMGLISVFVLIAASAVLAQAVVLNTTVIGASSRMGDEGRELLALWPSMLWKNVLLTCVLLVPSTFVIGVLTTFRIAGPLYRMEMHLKQLIRGERPGRCVVRKNDALQDFCQLLNEAVAALMDDERRPREVGPGGGLSPEDLEKVPAPRPAAAAGARAEREQT
jgi:hypothetical protein